MAARSPWWIADFDSAAGFLSALASHLGGGDFRALGQPPWLETLARATDLLPLPLSTAAFAAGGALEAIAPRRLRHVCSQELAEWACQAYPVGPYPLIFMGSSSGALVNLCAALGAPWLPQTVLIPVRNFRGGADDPHKSLRLGLEIAPAFLEANPDLSLHHMHDPVQDRVMVDWMSYFRVKRLRLGEVYERFLQERLEPGGTIVLVDCRQRWPVQRLSDRHVFQFGAFGGAEPDDYYSGSERTARFLREQGSNAEAWDAPAANASAPEAEWGFEPALGRDAERFAAEHGYRVARLSYDEPGGLGPLVADLYRWWYARLGWSPDARLLLECFIFTAPAHVLTTGSIPFWTVFNTEKDLARLETYLNRHSFDEIAVSLFPNGVRGIRQATLEQWREQLSRARERGYFLGVNERKFPFDFATLANYHRAVRELPKLHELPPRLDPRELGAFLGERTGQETVDVQGF